LAAFAGFAVATATLTGWSRMMGSLRPRPTLTPPAPPALALTSSPAATFDSISASFTVDAPADVAPPVVVAEAPAAVVRTVSGPVREGSQPLAASPRSVGGPRSAGEATAQTAIRAVATSPSPVAEDGRNVAPVETHPRAAASAADLFARAGEARRSRDYDGALGLYRELVAKYPGSREAAVGQAIVAQLLLDRGDAAGALGHFDEYLSQGGPLGEDALVGRALALARLGKRQEEASAWTALLASYPRSVHAARARAQLAAVGDR
jgi:TolA-binding protein